MEQQLLQKKTWAVVGANKDREKFGNRIYRRLKALGYDVYAVNPVYDDVEGDLCYPNLSALPTKPDVVCIVVNPVRGLTVVEEAARLGIHNLWLQPGTHDDGLLARIDTLGLQAVKACVLVATDGR